MLYLVALPAVKIAVLLTYLRIFQSKPFRKLVYGALALNVAYAITFVFATAFQCVPVNLVNWSLLLAVRRKACELTRPQAWHHWDGEHPGRCNNVNAQSWASAAINIVLDVIVVVLPMPML